MAFGTASAMFVATLEDILENTTAIDLNTSTFNIALYDDTGTPSQTVTSANTAYNVDQWVTGNEVSDGVEWPAAGQALGSVTFAPSSNVLTWDAADEVSDGTSATLSDVRGCLIYDATVATPVNDQGICYLAFGGSNSVTDGTFTVLFAGTGLVQFTL
jgi:hypothetical protein